MKTLFFDDLKGVFSYVTAPNDEIRVVKNED